MLPKDIQNSRSYTLYHTQVTIHELFNIYHAFTENISCFLKINAEVLGPAQHGSIGNTKVAHRTI